MNVNVGRPLVLLFDVLPPNPQEDSGSLRAFKLMHLLAERYDVAFLPLMGNLEGPEANRLRENSIIVPESREAQIEFLTENRERVKWVQIARPPAFAYWFPLLSPLGINRPIVYDSVDAHFVRESREAEVMRATEDPRWFTSMANAAATKEHERLILEYADLIIAVSENDAAALKTLDPTMKYVCIGNIMERFEEPSPTHDNTVMFVGPRVHTPNVSAVKWITESIAPAALDAGLPFQFAVLGKGWEEFASSAPSNVLFPGWVDDLSPWYKRSLAAIAPLRAGAGVKGKVTEAAAHGCPVVGTDLAFEGLNLSSPAGGLWAETTDEFLQALVQLQADPVLRSEISGHAKHVIETSMGREAALKGIDAIQEMTVSLSSE